MVIIELIIMLCVRSCIYVYIRFNHNIFYFFCIYETETIVITLVLRVGFFILNFSSVLNFSLSLIIL